MSKNDFWAKAGTPDRQARLREALEECKMTMEDWGTLVGHKFTLDGFAHPKTRRGKVREIITEHIATNVVTEREQKVLEVLWRAIDFVCVFFLSCVVSSLWSVFVGVCFFVLCLGALSATEKNLPIL
jgi:hypothetical protein